jgi:hypothetical protein
MEPTNPLPANAGLTARVVYVQSCRECRVVVEALCLVWIANPSIGSFQCIASKKNHCCESGDALPRVTRPADEQPLFAAAPPPRETPEEARQKTRAEMLRRGMIEQGQCQHGVTLEFCAVCCPEPPISDTNGTLGEFELPNGLDG